MQDVEALVAAIQSRAWYPAAALGLTLLINAAKTASPALWDRIPQRLQYLPIVVLAGAGAFVDAWASGVNWQVALALAAYSLLAALAGIGAHHTAKRVNPGSAAALLLLCCAPLATGCAGSFEESRGSFKLTAAPRDAELCQDLDSAHRTYGAIGKTTAFLAGASGFATIPVESHDADVALAAGAVVAGAAAAGAVYLSESAAESWARECGR